MTTVVGSGAEARAGALGERAERARDWPADEFATPFSSDLFVLDEDERGGDFANYVWYRLRLIVGAERLWNTHGVQALHALQAGETDIAAEVGRSRP